MIRNNLRPLHAAIEHALRRAPATKPQSTAGVIAALALSATALSPQARAANYDAGTETELRDAIDDANAGGDASATIILTADITLTSTTAFGALTKPITIDTNGFSLSAQSGISPGGALTFSNNSVSVTGAGALRGGHAANGTVALTGGDALALSNGSLANSASIVGGNAGSWTGGAVGAGGQGGAGASLTNGSITNTGTMTGGIGGNSSNGDGGIGGTAASVTNGSLTNEGSITGGVGGVKTGGASGGGGAGGSGVALTGGSLTNSGTITGGLGGGNTSAVGPGGTGGSGANLTGGVHVNNGTIRGGVGGEISTSPGHLSGGAGVVLSNGELTNNGLIEGGAISGAGTSSFGIRLVGNSTVTNNATIRAGSGGDSIGGAAVRNGILVGSGAASNATIRNNGTIEGGRSAEAILAIPFGTYSITLINSGTIRAGADEVNAIVFGATATTNALELHAGSVIEGIVLASTGVNDTLRLGGTANASFDVSGIGATAQYQRFDIFEKSGTSTWTLTGTSATNTSWRLLGGTLAMSQDGSLGGAAGAVTFNAGSLQSTGAFTSARAVTLNAGGGTFDTLANLTWSGVISGGGALTKIGSGTLVLTANNGYTGATNVNAGTLRVNGNQSTAIGLTTVANGATLGGNGTIGGAVAVNDGGHLAPGNSPGTLNMHSLTLSAGSVLDFELGEANVVGGAFNDLINVNGDLVLDGVLNVTPSAGGTFGAGVYRLINYTGNLTDNGLELGLMPAGSSNYIQTSFANQVNLVNTQGLVLNYWDGAADARDNGVIGGGNGVWQAATGNDNWTTADGSLNAGYASGSLAIFAGAAGTVTVDTSEGDVRVTGMQFATDGYRIEGDAITLTTGLDSIRVGDGTDTGAAFTATIASALTGEGTLGKTDLGTLVLTGENTYSGNTAVSAGTLQIGDGGASGSILGDVTNEGTLAFNRSDAVTFAGVVSGGGSFSQIGSGSTSLSGVNTYTGATTIASGTLALTGAGSIAASSGVVNEGMFDISSVDTVTSITTLSGSGSLVLGSMALTLTAASTTFSGVIDGAAGTLNLGGNGTWTLAGAGSQVGALNVQTGTLEVANGASLAAQSATVAAGATVRSSGTLTGTAGSDTLTLAGTLVGNVNLLDGDDHVRIAESANFSQATFDGGAGADTLELSYSSAFDLQNAPVTTSFEHLIMRGNGAFSLSGTVDSFSDGITVAEGTVRLVDASVVTTELRIESGVTISGTGSLSGNFVNAGVLSPGNSPGTIQIGGNFTQSASGVLVSEITRSGTDLLDVSGAASLGGTHQINVEYGLDLDGTRHTLIQAAGGISGDFSSVQINRSVLMTAERELGANALTLSFARLPMTSVTDPNSGRGRYAAWLEEQIDAGSLTQTMTDYIDSLLQQPTAQGLNALLSERGEPVAGVSQNSVSMLGAGFARTVFERFTVSDTAQCAPTQQGTNDALNCSWGHGLRQWGQAGGDSRYDWSSDGLQIGVDRALSSGWSLGGTFGYADTEVRDLKGAHSEVRSKMGGLYANYDSERVSLGAMTFYSDNDNSTRRSVLDGVTRQQARADFDSDSYGAGVRLSYRVTSESGPLVRPFIEAFYDHVERTRFSERNAGEANLSARIHDRDGLRGTLGLQLADNFAGYGPVFRPALELGIAHQFEDARSTLDLQPFSGTSSFRTYGPALDRTAYVARASLNVLLGANASIALGYGGEIAEDYSQHEGNLTVRVAW